MYYYEHHEDNAPVVKEQGRPCSLDFSYTSDNNTNWLSVEDLRDNIERVVDDYTIEKSRWSKEGVPD